MYVLVGGSCHGVDVRKQVYIEARQEALLKRRAKELGVSEAALIRQGIDQVARDPAVWLPDPRAWDEEQAFIEERARMNVPQTGRTWTRDELYDERLERFQRITVNPSQMGGVPCIRGLRLPVATAVAMGSCPSPRPLGNVHPRARNSLKRVRAHGTVEVAPSGGL